MLKNNTRSQAEKSARVHVRSSDKYLISQSADGEDYSLYSPTALPLASAFLWNSCMMIQANCRGYANAQFMQPEPSRYAHAPNMEAQTFMQPEQTYYAHHSGRFFYVKDQGSSELFSAPYEPVRAKLDGFSFTAGKHRIRWRVLKNNIQLDLQLSLSTDYPAELWQADITNLGNTPRELSVTPYFPVGYMSWMNQSGAFNNKLNAVVCRSVAPYQKYQDYFKQKNYKDLTYLLADTVPSSWEVRQSQFEGEGGLHAPSALEATQLSNSDALYEIPCAVLQYLLTLESGDTKRLRFIFGPAKDEIEIAKLKARFFTSSRVSGRRAFDTAIDDYANYINQGSGDTASIAHINTPDQSFNNFVNEWLPRQTFYHGEVNRLSTDPQTRNFLQDSMGMSYLDASKARVSFLYALEQQRLNGAMPDGILLQEDAQLKYINQVPHMDHCVWLPICIVAYLEESGDYALLDEHVSYADSVDTESVIKHVGRALHWLLKRRDSRGLNYIDQGDWCDPMNMVGYKGKGVSAWLTLATAYAATLWAGLCQDLGRSDEAREFNQSAESCNNAANQYLWSRNWYGRGITDDDVLFGTQQDKEGAIFLNPQAWAMLSGAASQTQAESCIRAIELHLETPFGVQMLAPAFTKMRDDIGRITQKHPGSAENGSVYNHAAAFYVYALYKVGQESAEHSDRAFRLLRQMIPGPDLDDVLQRGQLPVFLPNYYRGAYRQFPRTAGRSSQLFNTGTVHWFYRCLIDGLFGCRGTKQGLEIMPQLPSDWPSASCIRRFRGATLHLDIRRGAVSETQITVNGKPIEGLLITDLLAGSTYTVNVLIRS